MTMPSISWCGSISISGRSLQVPGSLSSPLARMYLGFAGFLGNEAPLHTGRKAGSAAPAQIGFLHFVDDLLGRHLLERFFERLIALGLQIDIDAAGIAHTEALADYRNFGGRAVVYRAEVTGAGGGCLPACNCSRRASIFSRIEIFVEIVIHLDSRRACAGANAFDFLERKGAGLRDFLVADAQPLLHVLEKSLPPRSMQEMLVQT